MEKIPRAVFVSRVQGRSGKDGFRSWIIRTGGIKKTIHTQIYICSPG